MNKKNHMDVYNEFWKPIVEDNNGALSLDKVAKELADFSDLMDRMTKLNYLCSDGVLSYPTYDAETIYSAFQEALDERYEMGYNDAKEDMEL